MLKHDSSFGRQVDERFLASLDRYVNDRIPTGGFLEAVLSNDLFGAVSRADEGAKKQLAAIVGYIFNELPMGCHGSRDRVREWLSSRVT